MFPSTPTLLSLTTGTIIVAFSLTTLVLVSQNLAWYNDGPYVIDVEYTIWNDTSRKTGVKVRTILRYEPTHLTFVDTYAMLVSALLGLITVVVVSTLAIKQHRKNASQRVTVAQRFRNVGGAVLSVAYLIATLIATAIAWRLYVRADKNVMWLDADPQYPDTVSGAVTAVSAGYTFETWNYALQSTIPPDATFGTIAGKQVERLSERASYVRYLTIPFTVFALVLVVIQVVACKGSRTTDEELAAKLGRVELVGDVELERRDRDFNRESAGVSDLALTIAPPGYERRETGLPAYTEV